MTDEPFDSETVVEETVEEVVSQPEITIESTDGLV